MAFPFRSVGLLGRPSAAVPRARRKRRLNWRLFSPRWGSRSVVPAHQRLVVEALESRLLLNADVLALDLSHTPGHVVQDHQLLVQLVQDTTHTDANAVAVQNVQIIDQSNGNAVLAFGALADISAISINTGDGNNTVTVDADTFKNVLAPSIS